MPHDPHVRPTTGLAALLVACEALVQSLYAESRSAEWGLTCPQFAAALERSAKKQFPAAYASPWPKGLEAYLKTLYVQDLALSAACLEGSQVAWEHFVGEYRGYLRAAAGAITKGSRGGIAAQELADSLFAELFGLVDGKRGERSLFRYFHGRSSLKTWLRAVLAQRHIDRIRESRRWESIDSSESEEPKAKLHAKISPQPLDPHRERYLACFASALEAALASLAPADRQRLELYYHRQQTLAEIGRSLGEHESSVSRHLERCRRELRASVEEHLRRVAALSDAEMALCFEYAAEDVPIDFRNLFPEKHSGRPGAGRKEPS